MLGKINGKFLIIFAAIVGVIAVGCVIAMLVTG